MATQRIVNDNGLLALKQLAKSAPRLFVDANPDALEQRMKEISDTDEIWGGPLDMEADISSLNEIEMGGPSTDSRYVPIVRAALGHLPPSQGLDANRWATINCFVIPEYASTRWGHVLPSRRDDESAGDFRRRLTNYVEIHWLKGNLVGARQSNSIARLWWLGEFACRAAEFSPALSEEEILDAMANNVNLYHQFMGRPNLISRSALVAAVYEVFLDDNQYLNVTRPYASPFMAELNLRAADVSLDFMDHSELLEVVEEAKPTKKARASE